MDKKAWAIIGIIVFHLVLMWFIRGSFQPEELAVGSNPEHPEALPIVPNPYLARSPVAADAGGTDVASVQKHIQLRPVSGKTYTPPKYARQIRTKKIERPPGKSYAVNVPIFKDTIIYVKQADFRHDHAGERMKLNDSSVQPVQAVFRKVPTVKPKKRSIIRRSIPVIRKPYEWLKTLVSKL